MTKKPVDRVVLVGTKEPPKPKRAPRQLAPAAAAASGGVWDRLAQCESGGNWSINTGNGYYGGLQFSLGTWRAYGGTGSRTRTARPSRSPSRKKLQAAAGWGQWPACSRKLGLR